MEEKVENTSKFNLAGFGKAISFLMLEILAVVSFSLGNSFLFFAILAIVILLLIIAVTFKQIKVDGLASIGVFIFPLVIFGLISALSYFKYDPYYVLNNSPLLYFIPVVLACFAASGYFINLTGTFKIHHALIVIYSAIALLTLINFVVTMIQFVPFYSLSYTDYYYYYDGVPSPSPISDMAYFLMGFSLQEVSLSYFTFYPMILLTAFLPLGHIKFKENRKLFVLYLAFGVLGLISIIFTINKVTLLVLFGVALLIGLIALYDKFNINRKPLKIAATVLGVVLGLGLIFLIFNAQESVGYSMRVGFLRSLTTGNSLFNRLFNSNRFVSAYNSILDGLFARGTVDGSSIMLKLYGFPINGDYVNLFGAMEWELTDSHSFLFDSFFSSGFFGALFLIGIVILGLRKVVQYYNTSDDDKKDKVMVLGFVIISLAYALINFDSTPYIFNKFVIPFYLNNIFFIDLFLFGYCYFKSEKKKEAVAEENAEEEPVVEEVIENEE